MAKVSLATFPDLLWRAITNKQSSVKDGTKANTYEADSREVEKGSDDRYSSQEIDGHRKEPTEKSKADCGWRYSKHLDF